MVTTSAQRAAEDLCLETRLIHWAAAAVKQRANALDPQAREPPSGGPPLGRRLVSSPFTHDKFARSSFLLSFLLCDTGPLCPRGGSADSVPRSRWGRGGGRGCRLGAGGGETRTRARALPPEAFEDSCARVEARLRFGLCGHAFGLHSFIVEWTTSGQWSERGPGPRHVLTE